MPEIKANGKHLELDGAPFRVKGVTYGTFSSRLDGARFPEPVTIKTDLVDIATSGLNTVRTYTIPPPELLDVAEELGLLVIVGLDYHDWRIELGVGSRATRRILEAGRGEVNKTMEVIGQRSNVLAIAVGSELPVDLVRLHGAASVEHVLSELIAEVHEANPQMLATYVNFPTTEFLEIENQDLACFNVFLERAEQLHSYLAHLQVVTGDLPLVVTELGLAGDVHGESAQAESLRWQLETVDETGCAGATVFSWTDEWAVDDQPVIGWGFGLLREDRTPKPALQVASEWAHRDVPDLREKWPSLTVVVCAYNEERTLSECLTSLQECRYPDMRVVVCDDGSTDRTLEIARQFPFEVLELPHAGLSRARNAGLKAATSEIVAFLDADASCHSDWPFHLALSLEDDSVVATGGPNLPHPAARLVEKAVDLSPGSPMEVLVSPERAEHVPGCNMAFKMRPLMAIGGFDPAYLAAGDDVDVCWKLLDEGYEIAFASAAQVIHHRRNTISGYLRQQRGYGRAERMLSGPHRHRFNRFGQARWSGFVYGGSRVLPSLFRPVVYTGFMGMAPFQPIVKRRSEQVGAWAGAVVPLLVPLMLFGLVLVPLSTWWLLVPAASVALAVLYGLAISAAATVGRNEARPWRLRTLVGLLHLLQPVARAWGRITGSRLPRPRSSLPPWVGDRHTWLKSLTRALQTEGLKVRVALPGRSWDLKATLGLLVSAQMRTAVVWRWEPPYRVSHRPTRAAVGLILVAGVIALGAPVVGLVALGAGVTWAGVERGKLRRRVHRAIARTTHASDRGNQDIE